MDKNQARLVLQACRPDGGDSALPVFAEALAFAENDPELKVWWAAQQAFDRKVSAKLQGVPLPDNLRATILAGRKIEQFTPGYRLPYWFAAVAAIVLFFGIGHHYWPRPSLEATQAITSRDYDASIFHFIDNGPALGLVAHDHAEVNAWLRQRHAPTGSFPASMANLSTLGCQQLAVHGHTVSFICFSLAGGEVAHLFIVEKQALSDPPGSSPVFAQNGTWSTAAWSDSGKSYLLLTEASPGTLQHLL